MLVSSFFEDGRNRRWKQRVSTLYVVSVIFGIGNFYVKRNSAKIMGCCKKKKKIG